MLWVAVLDSGVEAPLVFTASSEERVKRFVREFLDQHWNDTVPGAAFPYPEDATCDEVISEYVGFGEAWQYCHIVEETPAPNPNPWLDNRVQFPRLLAEIYAVGLTPGQMSDLCASMDIQGIDLQELFERAETEFERIKEEVARA